MTLNWPEKATEEISREEHLFLAARRISDESERQQFLAEHCDDDPELLERLTALLRIDASDPTFLEPMEGLEIPAQDLVTQSETAGRQVGSFTLEAEIGSGGMGIVWLAKQERPVRRHAALKLMQPGWRSGDRIHRFERERQMLAAMGHPAIPKLLDAGSTADGSPWFAMELVDGVPLTRYCRDSRLTLERRLKLFADLCDAVQHVHQLGIVHRDIKPGNVLVSDVDGRPLVRLIDFGAALWLSDDELDAGDQSDVVSPIGTLIYMSPEQADSEEPPSPQNDVYSLGAVLYELLTESRPIDVPGWQDASTRERRSLLEQFYAVPPSVRVARRVLPASDPSLASDSFAAGLRLPADLDSITRKALVANQQQRYSSARELAQDVRRLLMHQCVSAHPRTGRYVAECYWKRNRNRILTAVSGFIGTVIIAMFAIMAWQKSQEVAKTRQEQLIAEARFAADAELRKLNSYAADMQIGMSAHNRGMVSAARQRLESAEQQFPSRRSSFEQSLLRKMLSSKSQILEAEQGYVFNLQVNPQQSILAIATGSTRCRVSLRSLDGLVPSTVLTDFNNDVNVVDFSSDGDLLLTGDEDGSCRIFDVSTGAEVRRFNCFQLPIAAAAFLDEERKFMATEIDWRTLDATTHVTDVASEERLASFPSHRLLALSPDRTSAALSIDHARIRLIRCSDFSEIASLDGEKREISCGCFSPDGVSFVAGTRHGKLLVWKTQSSEMVTLETPLNLAIRGLAFHPNGTFVAAGYSNGGLRIWDIQHGTCAAVLEYNHGPCWSLETINDQNLLIAGFEDSTVKSFNWSELTSHVRYPQTDRGLPQAQQISVSSDGLKAILAWKDSSEIELIDLSGQDNNQRFRCETKSALENAVAIPESDDVLVTDETGRLYRFNGSNQRLEFICETYQQRLGRPTVSNDGRYVSVFSSDGDPYYAGIWDLTDGKNVWQVPQNPGEPEKQTVIPNRVAQIIDKQTCLTLQADSAYRFSHNGTSSTFKRYSFRPTWVFSARLTPDQKLLAIGREDYSISFIDPSTGLENMLLIHPGSHPLQIAFTRDSVLCATGGFNGSVALWHLPSGRLLHEFQELSGQVSCLEFSDDGTLLTAVASSGINSSEIIVWDARTRTHLEK